MMVEDQAAMTRTPDTAGAGTARGWVREDGRTGPLPGVESGLLEPGLCVVVCTLSRPASVRRFLRSLREQDLAADELIVVDASENELTEAVLHDLLRDWPNCPRVIYARVTGEGVGLTRQRNLAAQLASRCLIAYFDDDIILMPGCLRAMERVHQMHGQDVVGVGAIMENEQGPPRWLWRMRRALGIVKSLEPGRYHRSGMSTPWRFLECSSALHDGDWLPGGAMMWRTETVRGVRFRESFRGYAQGEDLDFSLRVRPMGRLVVTGAACAVHEHVQQSRPGWFTLGYMALHNRYVIHRDGLPNRKISDVLLFAYAWALDTILLARHLAVPGRWRQTFQQVAGRIAAAIDLVVGRQVSTRLRQ
jgi:GT2 family glycosyltransferase